MNRRTDEVPVDRIEVLGNLHKSAITTDSLIEAKQIGYVVANSRIDALAGPVWALAVVFFVGGWHPDIGEVPIESRAIWLSMAVLWSAVAWALRLAYLRSAPEPEDNYKWCKYFAAVYAVNGAIWGAAAWLLWIEGSAANNLALIIIVMGASVTYAFQQTPHFAVFIAATVPLHVLFTLRYITDLDGIGALFVFAGPAFAIWIIVIGRENSRKLAETLKLQVENEELAEHLATTRDGMETQVVIRTKQLERQLRWREQAQKKLQAAKEQAETVNKAKSTFLSSMSHELRTPMNAVLGFAQLLEQDGQPLTESQKEFVAEILRSGHHMLELINDVLDLEKIESGDVDLDMEDNDPGPLIDACLKMVDGSAVRNDVTVTSEFAAGDLPMVKVDGLRFKQALLNLLSNAVKYNRPGGQVVLECNAGANGILHISVSDTGPGIADDMRGKVFEPYDRLGAESSSVSGTGIGLTITKQLIESMGGTVGFESTVGEGTTFWINLPVARTKADQSVS